MRLNLLSMALCALFIGLPIAQAQYLEPEQVLYPPSSTQREVHRQTEAEKEQEPTPLRQQRPVFLEWWLRDAASSAGAATSAAPTPQSPFTSAESTEPTEEGEPTLDPVTARLFRRLQSAESAWIAQQGDALQSTALHSGAPLAPTGPAETATVVLLFGTIGWILWRSRGMKQFLAR